MKNIRYSQVQGFLSLSAVLLLVVFASAAQGQGSREKGTIYEQAKAAAVEVLVNGHLNGTGWFADAKGLLFTAAHVIERPGTKVEVTSPVIGRVAAEVVAVDLGHDLALLRVAAQDKPYPTLALADKLPAPGEEVFLFGTSLYRHAVLLHGTMARDDTTFEYYEDHYSEVTHIAATVPAGMSGGPWLNSRGEVVALSSAVMSQDALPLGVSFAIPVPALRLLLKTRKTAATPALGAAVEELWQHDTKMIGRFPPQTEGLLVVILQNDGPAARGGLKQDDLIIAANGVKVRLAQDLLSIIVKKSPGQTVELDVLSPDGAGERKVTIALGKLEVSWP